MEATEIKELYFEELDLLKRIQVYRKEYDRKNLDRVEKVILLLLYRIYSNLYSSLLLTAAAHKKGKMVLFQLPLGIILRCTYTDCLFALYLQRVEKNRANEELDLRKIEYANSLLERREVYRDQVKSSGMGLEDSFIDNLWQLTMEDNFMHLLTFDDKKEKLQLTKRSKEQLHEAGFSNLRSVTIKEQKDFLTMQEGIETLVERLYHYYKYFSQYEHFSENGQGDILVSSQDDGNDNIHFPSAIRALSAGVEAIISMSKNA